MAQEKKYAGRTVEEWFRDIARKKATPPNAMRAFLDGRIGQGAKNSVPFLIDVLSDKSQKPAHYVATFVLSRIGKPATDAVPVLKARAVGRGSSETVEQAYMALAAIDPKSLGIDFWQEALKHKNQDVTKTAAEALGKIGPSAIGAIDDLFESLLSHQSFGLPQVYCEVLAAIMKIAPNDPRVLDAAKSGLAILEYYRQKAAVTALLEVGTREALDVLRNAYCIHPNAELVKRVHKLVEKRLPGFQFNPKPTANCPECGQQLRTFLAKQCFHCGAKWRKK